MEAVIHLVPVGHGTTAVVEQVASVQVSHKSASPAMSRNIVRDMMI